MYVSVQKAKEASFVISRLFDCDTVLLFRKKVIALLVVKWSQ